jgi:hypothetical protein
MLLAGLIFSLHHWVAIARNRGDYSPFAAAVRTSSLTYDETQFYAPPARRFMMTGKIPAEFDVFESRGRHAGIPYLPSVLLGGLGRLAGSLEWAFILSDFLFPALALWLLYMCSEGIVGNHWRLFAAWIVLLIPFTDTNFFWYGYDMRIAPADFSRTPNPEITFPLLIGAVLLLVRALHAGRPRDLLASALVSTLIVYSYYFYTLAWALLFCILMLLAAFWRNREIFKRLIILGSLIAAGSLPFLWVTYAGMREGDQKNLLYRQGIFRHTADVPAIFYLAIGLWIVWKFGPEMLAFPVRTRITVLFALALAGFAGLNLQVITGYDAQHTHFWNRLIAPIAYFLFSCWLFSVIERSRSPRAILIGRVVLALLIANAAARQFLVAKWIAETQRATRPEIEVLAWTRNHLRPGVVVGTLDPEMISMLPALTADFSYVPAAGRSTISMQEVADRYYDLAAINGLTDREFAELLAPLNHFSSRPYVMEVLHYYGSLESFLLGYSHHVERALGRRLDYMILSAPGLSPSLRERFPNARAIHSNSAFEVVALRSSDPQD